MSTTTEPASSNTDLNREHLLRDLAHFTGDLERYRHWTGRTVYTPGVQYLAQKANAYWLIDLVVSWQLQRKIAAAPFQIWKLTVRRDRTATATATNGGDRELATQAIPFTDFPLEEVSLWLVDGTLMLPSEY